MAYSLVMLGFFAAGVLAARLGVLPRGVEYGQWATWVFYAMLAVAGISVGSKDRALSLLARAGWRIAVVPGAVVAGTLLGSAAASLVTGTRVLEALAVGAGFGYYSLSSILITKLAHGLPSIGESLPVVALLSNICREIVTIVSAPLLARRLGGYAPIAAGGATTMDSTLAVITKFSGSEYAMVSLFNGVVLTFLVPILVPLMVRLAAWSRAF